MSKKNTAMQENISRLKELQIFHTEDSPLYNAFLISINIANQLLEKEKSQIVDAFEKGCDNGAIDYLYSQSLSNNEPITSEDYFNQTYNK